MYCKLFLFHVGRLTIGREKEREAVRQCFLFSNHLIITSRTQGGKLHLVDIVGKIPLADITLLEDPNEEERTEDQGTLFDYLSTYITHLSHHGFCIATHIKGNKDFFLHFFC